VFTSKVLALTHHDISLEKIGALCVWLEDVSKRQKEPCVHAWKIRNIKVSVSELW
jgi:hypothetical protein